MPTLKQIIEETDTLVGRMFDWFVQALIVFSLVTFSFETLPHLHQRTYEILKLIETICIIIFALEYMSRIAVATSRPKFIFSFFGVIDLIAILPFYLTVGIDLRAVRAFRLLRVFRILKLFRYSEAIKRFQRAFRIAKQELMLFFFTSSIVIYLSAVGIYYFEHPAQPQQFKSVLHSLWWAVATLTTVGYGDVYPVTAGGKIFTFVVLMVGLAIVAAPSAVIASALNEARRQMREELKSSE